MKLSVAGVVLAAVLVSAAVAAEDGANWLTDFEMAKAASAEGGKPILADFSGSDWCGWCIKLDKEVFSTEEFQAYARDNLVLFLADFPARKKLPKEVSDQNKKLSDKYGIQGYPTVLLLDSKGQETARTGYQRGGGKAYVKHLKELLATKE